MIDLQHDSRERLMEVTRTLAQWTRLSGTAEERAAADYVAARMRESGYTVTTLEHDAYISLPGPARLAVTRPQPRDIACITHSMGSATGPAGISGELVYAGKGQREDFAGIAAAGTFALVDGRATPQRAVEATRAGVKGLVCISGRIAHEMCCSPVWGNPSASTVEQLPRVILISVNRAEGEELRELCRRGRVEVHVTADVDTRWTRTPIVQADLAPAHRDADDTFVMLSGHLDSWYRGAMDNGTANAAMIEVARLIAGRRSSARRGLRVLFWSGHSHGRYSSSAWYADNYFVELDERCVAHVNVDCLGAIDADWFGTNSMPETAQLAIDATRRVAKAELDAHRVGRNSDQSFFGIGIPTILGSISRQQDGALGWWWHTPEDALDKIDPIRLERDAAIALEVTERLVMDAVLPLDYAASAVDVRTNLEKVADVAGQRFDLSPAIREAMRLEKLCADLAVATRDAAANDPGGQSRAAAINTCLRQLGRILIPVTYTRAGRHAHDPALDVAFLPKLDGLRRLASVSPESDAARFLSVVDLTRARSELTISLRHACATVEACLR